MNTSRGIAPGHQFLAGIGWWKVWELGWRPGSVVAHAEDEVFVSVTDFHVHRIRHAPGAWLTGLRLRHAWPQTDGAVGLWLWAEPFKLRSGSVSVWSSERALTEFIRSEHHRAIMRAYRPRMSGTSIGWVASRFDRRAIWDEAVSRLTTS